MGDKTNVTSVMNEQKTLDYARIAQAIGYIRENFKRQPGLDEIAVGQRELLFQKIEISFLIYHQNSHDAQSDLAFECFINILECFYHL